VALGVSFVTCFATGFLSHLIQHPPSWFAWPSRPAGLYRLSQGIHVVTGIASIPLLLAKLWTVYPSFWTWPPIRSAAHSVERISLLPLVGGSLFMLFSGVASISRWLPWGFSFPPVHYAVAWITIGSLVVHVGAKLGATRLALSSRSPDLEVDAVARERAWGGLSRRGFLGAVAAASGALVATTVGQTLRPLAPLGLLAPRDPRVGPQGVPVNKTAAKAGVVTAATDPSFRLRVDGDVATAVSLSLDDLRSMSQRTAVLPIACVDGWSANASWRGIALRDLVELAGGPAGASVIVHSLQKASAPYASAEVNHRHAADPDTLLALELNGEPLALDHGFPIRLIGPNRPGVMQTKWVGRVEVIAP
jgi:DMSO/TMAO reductase YedYZ molybdopterin-dependent catalytic subunit